MSGSLAEAWDASSEHSESAVGVQSHAAWHSDLELVDWVAETPCANITIVGKPRKKPTVIRIAWIGFIL